MTFKIINKKEIEMFVEKSMIAVGTDPNHAKVLAEVLIMADYRGHYSHGLNRLDHYLDEIRLKATAPTGEPTILKESCATALVDGNNLLGPVVGKFCMNLAISKAKESGIGWVSVKGSNHFGIAGYYSLLALEHQLLGMAFTNGGPLVVTTRGRMPVISTNPLSLAAPANNCDSFVLDMATSSVAIGKIEIADRKGDPIPEGWAIDKNGNPIKNFSQFHALLPLGGNEKSSGYKGYGLAVMVEIFCSVLSGSTSSKSVPNWGDFSKPANLGHCFITIDPECFAPGFADRLSDLIDSCRNQEPALGEGPVLVAGDPERIHTDKCDSQGGIEYHENQIKYLYAIASELNIEPPNIVANLE